MADDALARSRRHPGVQGRLRGHLRGHLRACAMNCRVFSRSPRIPHRRLHVRYPAAEHRLRDAPEESERAQYVGTVSVCLKTIMEIQTGVCGTDPEVRAILELPPDTTARQTAQAK